MATDGITFWSFPPALNITFRDDYEEVTRHMVNSTQQGARDPGQLLLAAVQNLTLDQRVDPKFKNEGWGGTNAVVTVGDVIELDWNGIENRTAALDCMICWAGQGNGTIETACANYTESGPTSPQSAKRAPMPPRHAYTLPALNDYFPLPDTTCGLCIFTLYSISGLPTTDFSVPFLVLQKGAIPHKRFNAEHPTGIEDRTIPTSTVTASIQDPVASGNSPNVRMIVGVVVGVLGGAALLALLSWLLWRRKRAKAKVVDSSASSTADRSRDQAAAQATQDIALRRIQGVVRRPDSRASEVPPPYHEAIRGDQAHRYG